MPQPIGVEVPCDREKHWLERLALPADWRVPVASATVLLFLWLYRPAAEVEPTTVLFVATIPVVAAGLFWGYVAALAAAALMLSVGMILYDPQQPTAFIAGAGLTGALAAVTLVAGGVGCGTLRTAVRRLSAELDRRYLVEQELRRTQDELEHRVRERTAQLARAKEELETEIEQHEQTERALAESEERFALAVAGANDGIWDWDLRTDRVYYAPRWCEMLGLPAHRTGDTPDEWLGRVHVDDHAGVRRAILEHLEGHTDHLNSEHRLRYADGTYRWMQVRARAVNDEEGHPRRLVGSMSDVTERRVAEELLQYDAFYDRLTNLPNRALFMDRLAHAVRRAQRRGPSDFTVLFIDLDAFKMVNDSLGHDVGDELLQRLASRLRRCMRPEDTIARFGGDEFTVLLDGAQPQTGGVEAANRILSALRAPFDIDGNNIYVGASIGIVGPDGNGYARAEDVLRDADIAMYRAKAQAPGSYVLFDQRMHAEAVARLSLKTDLQHALERGEFVLHYQPIMDLGARSIAGFEALIRWNHPRRGLIQPDEFIPMAEETGLIVDIGEWVLREACRQLNEWHTSDDCTGLFMTVNLSTRQLALPELQDRIAATLRAGDLAGCNLKLEITEGAFIEQPLAVQRLMNELREMDIQLCIDDFGTGYSSLSYLNQLPLDALKVDRSFVRRMDGGTDDNSQIVRAVVSLAHSLSLDVIAEGIESEHQLERLRELNCRYGQGFLFSPPIAPERIARLLSERAH